MAAATVTAEVSAPSEIVNRDAATPRWSLPTKIAFRLSFCYLMLYMFCNGNVTVFTIFQPFPVVEGWIGTVLFTPFYALTQILSSLASSFCGFSKRLPMKWV
jgi:hypothetical protein